MECENCGIEHNGKYGSSRFCSSKCAKGFSTKAKRKEINERVSRTLTGIIPWNKGKGTNIITEKVCLFCNGSFIGKTTQKFCSHKCHNDFQRLGQTAYRNYKQKCKFNFNIYDYPEEFNLSLLKIHGWYKAVNKGNNLIGISRDHRFSIRKGFENNIPPEFISHPTNCELMRHPENNKKNTNSTITINELCNRIQRWNLKYKCPVAPSLAEGVGLQNRIAKAAS